MAPEQATVVSKRAVVAFVAVLVVGSALIAIASARLGFPLTNDGPAQLFNAYAVAHIDDARFAPFFVENTQITGRVFPFLIGLADAAIGWRDGTVVVFALASVLSFLAFAALIRKPIAIAAVAFAFPASFYLGLIHYQLGVAFGLFAIAWWTRPNADARVVDVVVTALLLYLSAAAHAYAAGIAGAVCFALTAVRPSTKRFVAVVLSGIPAALVALWSRGQFEGVSDPDVWPSLVDSARLQFYVAGPVAFGVVLWLLAIAAGVVVLVRFRASSRGHVMRALVAFVLLAIALFGPRDFGGWQLVGLRPTPFAAALFLTCLDVDHPKMRRALLAAASIAALLAFAFAFGLHARLAAEFGPVVDRIDALKPAPEVRGDLMLEQRAHVDNDIPLYAPYRHIGQLANLKLGGAVAYGFFSAAKEPIKLKPKLAAPALEMPLLDRIPPVGSPDRAPYVRRLAALTAPMGAVFAFGTKHDLDEIVAAGFDVEQRLDAPDENDPHGVLVARFVGCRARFAVPPHQRVSVGFLPMKDAAGSLDVDDPAAPVSGLGCGPMWFDLGTCRVHATLGRDRIVDVGCP